MSETAHPIMQLMGLSEEDMTNLAQAVLATAGAAYWDAIEEAIGQAMIEGRIWNGKPETAAESRAFIQGQIGLEATGDGRLMVRLFGQRVATVHPPKAVVIPRPDEARIVQ